MTRIELQRGGFLLFHDPFLTRSEADASFPALLAEVPFQQQTIRLFGKSILQPRLSAWHGDAGASYTYSGLSLTPNPWTPALSALRARVEAAAGCTFNSVLVNHYRDGDDSMGKHADDEPELGENPVIASLSLGARRKFVLEPKHKGGEKVTLELGEGNLLVMAGTTQHHYRHGVPKQAGREARMNLTFRRIFGSGG
ncbi:alpha-ketoglutarate-dependent dioxygenase AlkB family protein [Polyangium sorediatum]|uniref:Alpha-ketoglutarate-dependent dioxygenase AlkB n=1 Tax=Polyangium sorediatum TaxID=889274 RepID=A0ABT6NXZ7_9BACT|nr:alpha-ketoglutarate-dependent dioxygenase AlkB [Polyangium sorediatum]MDI1433227.1 alpha-ketoglutarate-dependent dioxygenase AlkB [Polyangium sorediatum]